MATLVAENVRAELEKLQAKAKEQWAVADGMRAAAIKEGVNLAAPESADAAETIREAFRAYDETNDQAAQMKGMIAELEGIDARYRSPGYEPPQDRAGRQRQIRERLGARFTDNDQYQALHKNGIFNAGQEPSATAFQAASRAFERPISLWSRDEFEALLDAQRYMATALTGGGSTSVGPFIINDLQPGFVPYLRKTPRLAGMVANGTTDSDVVEYVTQTAISTAAAETAEGTAATEAAYTFATNTTNVREITHFVPVTLRAMADFGQIQAIIENELGADVLDRLDTQIANGNASGQNLAGIYGTSGINTQPLGGDQRADALHKAINQIRIAAGVLLEPDFIGMYPTDWQKLRLERDADGQYLFGPPGMAIEPQVWGFPVVVSPAFTSGTPLVGNFFRGATLWLREGLSVTSGLDGNDFTKRQISLLAAMRAAFAVTRPTAFTTVTGF